MAHSNRRKTRPGMTSRFRLRQSAYELRYPLSRKSKGIFYVVSRIQWWMSLWFSNLRNHGCGAGLLSLPLQTLPQIEWHRSREQHHPEARNGELDRRRRSARQVQSARCRAFRHRVLHEMRLPTTSRRTRPQRCRHSGWLPRHRAPSGANGPYHVRVACRVVLYR